MGKQLEKYMDAFNRAERMSAEAIARVHGAFERKYDLCLTEFIGDDPEKQDMFYDYTWPTPTIEEMDAMVAEYKAELEDDT